MATKIKRLSINRIILLTINIPTILIVLLFGGCQKEEEKIKPIISTTQITDITANSVISGGKISNDGGTPVTTRGIVWDTSPNATTALPTKTIDGSGVGTFTSKIIGLLPLTKYFIRSYATNSIGTSYGDELTFTTLANLPSVTTNLTTNLTSSSILSGGTIINDGGATITARGVVWGTSSSPTTSLTTKTVDGSGVGAFESTINGLTFATKYYIRAYATNSIGTSYGNELTFTTLPIIPTLTTTPVTNLTSVSASSGGTISSDGGAPVTSRGIVWDNKTNPTIQLVTKTSDGSGVGNFISELRGLNPSTTYYVRAYATNSAGTSYGNELTFMTNSLQSHDFNKVQIPVGGNSWVDNGAVITPDGLTNWVNSSSTCKTYIRLSQPGTLKVSLKINATSGNNNIKVTILYKSVQLPISGNVETEYFAGQWDIANEGYISIDIQGVSRTSTTYGVLSYIFLSGSAVSSTMNYIPNNDNNMFYWGRRGVSLHLWHDITGSNNIEWFYSEIKVPANNDVVGSYYMANGFGEGYFGMQVSSATERRVLFSIWSPYVTDDPTKIPPEDKVILIRKGANVITGTFGNEGSGGQSYLVYNWKAESTYKFLVQGKPIENNFTQYTAWFFSPDESKWFLIASWKRPKTSTYLKNLYSFLENFYDNGGARTRMALYGNQWIKENGGNWKEISKATLTGSNESMYRKDYAGGISNGTYYLKIAGFFSQYTPLNQAFERFPINVPPDIDFSTLP